MSKLRNEILYGMFPIDVYHVSLNYYVSCKDHNSYQHQGQALAFAHLPPPLNYEPRERYEKNLLITEAQVKRTISKSKSLITLLLVELNTSEEVKFLHPLHKSTMNDVRNMLQFFIAQF